MESFSIHMYVFQRNKWRIFSSVGAELLLVQFFVIQAFLVKRKERRKGKSDVFKTTENLLFSFLEFDSLTMA